MSKRNYVGRGWVVKTKFGALLNIALNKEAIERLPTNNYGDVRLTVMRRKEPDERSGATYYVVEDEYNKPKNKGTNEPTNEPSDSKSNKSDLAPPDDESPF